MTYRFGIWDLAMLVPQRDGGIIASARGRGTYFIVRDRSHLSRGLLALLVVAPVVAGCSGGADMFQSDLLSKDAEWFSRPGRLFIRSVSIDTPPLTPDKPVTAEDLEIGRASCRERV